MPSETVTFTTFTPSALNLFSTKLFPVATPMFTLGTALSTNQVYVGLTKLLWVAINVIVFGSTTVEFLAVINAC